MFGNLIVNLTMLRFRAILTKKDAEELLSRNIDNRPIDPKKVDRYREDMNGGHWNIDSSKSDLEIDQGVFKNGQHRLHGFLGSNLDEMQFYLKVSY